MRGRVQGVGFRAFTQRQAASLGIVGRVWNRADGGVEVLCQHADASVLDEFVARLEDGPGSVSSVVSQEDATPATFDDFEIVLGTRRD